MLLWCISCVHINAANLIHVKLELHGIHISFHRNMVLLKVHLASVCHCIISFECVIGNFCQLKRLSKMV